MKNLTKQNMLDYVTGAAIMGCGGGGGADSGRRMITEAIDNGHEFRLEELKDIPDDKILCIVAGVGGGVPKVVRDKVAKYRERFPRTPDSRLKSLKRAAEELSEYIGKEIYSYIAAETGGGNGVLPMYLNALEGRPSIDADCCGRAKPEMGMSLTKVAEIPITPLAMVTPFMETVILKSAVDDLRAEDITRYVAVASGGSVTVARCPATVKEYKRGVAMNQVSRCIKIGKAIRKSKEQGAYPKEAFLKASGAVELFEGKVGSFEMEGKGGFNWGNWILMGTGKHEGHEMKIWFKNENLVSWLDSEPFVSGPDLICILGKESFMGLSNFVRDGTHKGENVIVFGIPAIEAWKSQSGIRLFEPAHFGFDIKYIPLEEKIE